MGFFEIAMIGLGLSMDAFAAAVCKGLSMKKAAIRDILIIGLFFGGFQAMMPVIGYVLGNQFESYIESVDHWIAFGLLLFIGGKMIWDIFAEEKEGDCCHRQEMSLEIKEIVLLAVATSIDALAVGISFAFLHVDIVASAMTIGGITFAVSSAGVVIGNRFGSRYKNKAAMAGGLILIFTGFKILLEHLGYL